jgi:hypothetical protein
MTDTIPTAKNFERHSALAFISAPDPNEEMPEGVAVDNQGNVFGGFTQLPDIKKYVRN